MKEKKELLENPIVLELLKDCWKDAQYEMHKTFSSSYVGISFEKYIKDMQND